MQSANRARIIVPLILALVLSSGVPAFAQIDLTGLWAPRTGDEDNPERIPGPSLVEFLGLPINDYARQWGLAYRPGRLSLPEHQCQVHVVHYIHRGPLNMRLWEVRDPVTHQLIAIRETISTYEQERTIWMDGRPHPSVYAPHTWMGFSTGVWEGNMLTVTTTHVKQGWFRRENLPSSDEVTVVEHFVKNGNTLTHISVTDDPIYLVEPLIKTEEFNYNPNPGAFNPFWPCEYIEEGERPRGQVPHYLAGENPYVAEYASTHRLPQEVMLGGAATMYPEYRTRMKSLPVAVYPPPPDRPVNLTPAPDPARNITPHRIMNPRQMPFPRNPNFAALEVETLPVQGNIHLIAGAGGNIAVQTGDQGVLLVDTGRGEMGDIVLAAIRKLSPRPIRTIINTTLGDDYTGGTGPLVKAGSMNQAGPGLGGRPNEADLIGHAGLLRLMTEIGENTIATDRWPPSTFHGDKKDLYSNDEPVIILHAPNATTSGDTMVWFRKSDVIVTGPLFDQTRFPYIDVDHGGTINGTIEGLNDLLDIMVPKHLQEGGTMAVPGHGRISDEHDVLEYRNMVTIIRDRVQDAINKGMTLQQAQAAKPSFTYEFEPRFGNDPAWTPQMFIEAVYKTLTAGN